VERFVICRASAGSGKTYTLVRQFIEIAISSPSQLERRFEHILAVTFTNKAANGMKERIMSQLHKIVLRDTKSQNLVTEMAEHLHITDDEVRERCAVLQSAILHHYSRLSVCTIDSFVHRIVRTFAYDLHLPLNFNVLIDDNDIMQEIVDQLFAMVGGEEEEELTKVLCSFVESQMEEGKSYNVEKTVRTLAKQIFKENAPEYLRKLDDVPISQFMEIHKRLSRENRDFEKALSNSALEFVEECEGVGLSVDDFPSKGSGILAFMKRLAEGDFSKLNDPHKNVDNAYAKQSLTAKNSSPEVRLLLEKVTPCFMRTYDVIKSNIEGHLAEYNTRKMILANLYGMALLNKVNKLKEEYYKDNEIVHISEFNKSIFNKIADEPAPFVYERIGSRYYNYLIDEFQDTSELQWQNFLPLLDEAMTHPFSGDTAEVGKQSLVVGDGKQAIYRFRQGDVRQFMRLPEVNSKLHGKSLARNAKVDVLENNFRTKSNIVKFNNCFFEQVVKTFFADNEAIQKLYIGNGDEAELIQKPVHDGGYVGVSFVDNDRLYASVLDAIRHQVDDCHYNYGDIMILARKNDTLVKVSDYLTANAGDRPIPIVSSESFILSNSRVVLLLQSLLQYLYDESNRVAALHAVEYAVECGSIADAPSNSIHWQLCSVNYNLHDFFALHSINLNNNILRGMSLYDCCEQLLRNFKLEGKDTAYVASFLNVVSNFTQFGRNDLQSFLSYLDDRLDRLSCSTAVGMDAVQLMTVHKAKGLEAKVVIVVMPSEKTNNQQMWVDVEEKDKYGIPVSYVNVNKRKNAFSDDFDEEQKMNDMDMINVLYVALTRPEDKLLALCENKYASDGRDERSMLRWFATREEFPEGFEGFRTAGETTDGELYECGTDSNNPDVMQSSENQEDSPSNTDISNVVFPSWQDRMIVAKKSEAILSPLDSDSRRYGIVVHDMLAHINTVDDVERVVGDYCTMHTIGDDIRNAICSRITTMMTSADNARFFAQGTRSLCEMSIAIDGEIRRPDRVVFMDNETWVVDFKTGAYSEEAHRKYERQVAEYVAAIAAMGYPNVKSAVVYV